MSREVSTSSEPTEEEILEFDRLVPKAAQIHDLTWCVKMQWPRYTRSLRGRECLRCEEFVMRGGVCDPL